MDIHMTYIIYNTRVWYVPCCQHACIWMDIIMLNRLEWDVIILNVVWCGVFAVPLGYTCMPNFRQQNLKKMVLYKT